MVRTVKLSRAVPRDPARVKREVDLHVHLRGAWTLCCVLVAGAVGLGMIAARRLAGPEAEALAPPTWGFVALSIGFLVYAGAVFVPAVLTLRNRRRLFIHGKLMDAKVIGHETVTRRSSLGFKRTVHVIRAEVSRKGTGSARGAIETGIRAMLDALPVGAVVPALVDETRGDLLFPHELLVAVESES